MAFVFKGGWGGLYESVSGYFSRESKHLFLCDGKQPWRLLTLIWVIARKAKYPVKQSVPRGASMEMMGAGELNCCVFICFDVDDRRTQSAEKPQTQKEMERRGWREKAMERGENCL